MRKRKINILYIIDTLLIGGAEQHVATLCKHIDKEKFHVVVCTLFSRDLSRVEPFANEIKKLGIRVEQLRLTSWRNIQTFKKYLNLIDEEKIDIVHAHTIPADFWGCLIARIFKRRKTIVTIHGHNPRTPFLTNVQRKMVNMYLPNKLIVVSNLLKYTAINYNYAHPDKIIVIPNMVDTKVFTPEKKGTKIRMEYNIPEDVIILGSIGRFIKNKSFETCLQVFAEVKNNCPKKLKFILCGYGEEEDFYRTTAKNLGIEEDVIFTGPRIDVDEVSAAIDIFLFTPKHSEGFGMVLIEVMASGKPVVASNVTPTPDIVLNNITGFLPFPEDTVTVMQKINLNPFVEKILYLIENPEIRRKMGMEGRKIVEEKYSTTVVMKQIEALYTKLSCRLEK